MGITTDTAIKKAINEVKRTGKEMQPTINGCKGLFLRIRPQSGEVNATFCHRYTHPITKKRVTITLGTYDALTLANARQQHAHNLALLASATDPQEYREHQRQLEQLKRQNTLSVFIDEWERNNPPTQLKPASIQSRNRRINFIRQKLGHKEVTSISPQTVITFVNEVQMELGTSLGKLYASTLASILQLAIIKGAITHNPARSLSGAYKKHTTKHRPAITNPEQLGQLLRDIDSLKNCQNCKAYQWQILTLLALLFARIDDICSMRWQDLDFDNSLWNFEQQKAGGRDDMVKELSIPLPKQAIDILQAMQPQTGKYPFVFAKPRNKDGYVYQGTINSVLNSPKMNNGKGYQGIHCPHGFRATGKTILMERLGYDEIITELQIGHKVLNKYGKAYSRYEMIDQRREMLQAYADYLDELRNAPPKPKPNN